MLILTADWPVGSFFTLSPSSRWQWYVSQGRTPFILPETCGQQQCKPQFVILCPSEVWSALPIYCRGLQLSCTNAVVWWRRCILHALGDSPLLPPPHRPGVVSGLLRGLFHSTEGQAWATEPHCPAPSPVMARSLHSGQMISQQQD